MGGQIFTFVRLFFAFYMKFTQKALFGAINYMQSTKIYIKIKKNLKKYSISKTIML